MGTAFGLGRQDRIRHPSLRKITQDRRTALDLLAIKESLLDDSNHAMCRWVPGPQQLSDGLTKEKDNHVLLDYMNSNTWSLREDPIWQAQREKQRGSQKLYKAKVRADRALQTGDPGVS